MRIADVRRFFGAHVFGEGGVVRIASVLRISRAAVYLWRGPWVPEHRAYQLMVLTEGRLRISADCPYYQPPLVEVSQAASTDKK